MLAATILSLKVPPNFGPKLAKMGLGWSREGHRGSPMVLECHWGSWGLVGGIVGGG